MRAAQSIVEYTMLFMIISAAVIMTYKYLNRSVNAKLKQVQQEMEYKNY
jgi:Flp pilus assembly pilin Flp